MTPWAMAFHIVALVLWMGGLLVVTQVMAAHTRESSPEARQALGRLESKLFKGVAHPGAALVVVTGILLLVANPSHFLHEGWFHAKLFLVAILAGLDVMAYLRAKAFQAGQIELKRKECIVLHVAIAFVFLGIAILVFVKPI